MTMEELKAEKRSIDMMAIKLAVASITALILGMMIVRSWII